MYLSKNKVLIGIILYLVPIGFSWFIFRFISWLIQPKNSIENSIIAYGVFITLIFFSFIGGFLVARSGKKRSWWVKCFFAVISLIQFLPILLVLAPIGASAIWLNAKFAKLAPISLYNTIKNSRVGCTITSILASVLSFSGLLFILEKGNIKTAKSINQAVMAVTHWSSGDYFIAGLLAIFMNWRVMIGANLWKYKIFHWFFNAVGIPIEREEGAHKKRVEAIEKSKFFLANNKHSRLIVFPQGTRERHPENGISSLKIGAFIIACELGVPLIPVVIIGTNKWRPPSTQDTTSYIEKRKKQGTAKLFLSYLKQFFKTGINPTFAKVVYCNPISTVGKTAEEVRDETLLVMNQTYIKNTQRRRRKKQRLNKIKKVV